MNKILKSFIIITLIAVTTQVLALEYNSIQEMGSVGPNTELLQEELKKRDLYSSPVDGVFGSITKQAVISFQELFDLEPDGIAGPKTYEAFSSKPGVEEEEKNYLGSYTLLNEEHGTEVTITVDDVLRTIVISKLASHEEEKFLSEGDTNTQVNEYILPITPTWIGAATNIREPGIAINGVPFASETNKEIVCESGERYLVETNHDLDENKAYVQAPETYHYHNVSKNLVDVSNVRSESEFVHVGFAMDGYLIYYSGGGDYTSSYQLKKDPRTGSSCTYTSAEGGVTAVEIEGSIPDGTYVSDWEYLEGSGFLDECNGITIDGDYRYLLTHDYPFIGRCLNGEILKQEKTNPVDPNLTSSQEAVKACLGLKVNDSCFFTASLEMVSGTCKDVNTSLACVPR